MIQRLRIPAPVLALALLLLFNLFFSRNFFVLEIRDGNLYGTLLDILHQGAPLMLLAIGMSAVIGTGGIDLSVGSVMAISGAVGAVLVSAGHSPGFAFAAALATTTAIGIFNGSLVAYLGIPPIVVTLIMLISGRGIAMLIASGQTVPFEDPTFVGLGSGQFLWMSIPVWIVASVFLLATITLRRTPLRLYLEAIGENGAAAHVAGVNARATRIIAYGFASLCAGIAGLITAANIKAADANLAGKDMELDAIVAVVVGGAALTGGRVSPGGAILGALLLQTLRTTMYNQGVPPAITPLPMSFVVLAVCLLASERFRRQTSSLLGSTR